MLKKVTEEADRLEKELLVSISRFRSVENWKGAIDDE
jgi:hypothetical protein